MDSVAANRPGGRTTVEEDEDESATLEDGGDSCARSGEAVAARTSTARTVTQENRRTHAWPVTDRALAETLLRTLPHMKGLSQASTSLLVLATLILAVSPATAGRQVNPEAQALERFQERVKSYIALRDRVKANLPPLKPTNDPAVITDRQKSLAEAIRNARRDAKPGDVFVPEVATIMRRLIAADFTRRTLKQRRGALREVPRLVLHVNDEYPVGQPLATVPPRLIQSLPKLPDGLEYRFVGDSLILRDVNPNLVVDILERAIPRR